MVTFAKFKKMVLQVARERPGDYCEYKAGLMEMENESLVETLPGNPTG